MYIGLNVKYPLFLPGFNEAWIFSTDFREKKNVISNFMKILPVEAELFHADGQTDRKVEDNSRFSQFGEGAQKDTKNCFLAWHHTWQKAVWRNVIVPPLLASRHSGLLNPLNPKGQVAWFLFLTLWWERSQLQKFCVFLIMNAIMVYAQYICLVSVTSTFSFLFVLQTNS